MLWSVISMWLLIGSMNGTISPAITALVSRLMGLGAIIFGIITIIYGVKLTHAIVKKFGKGIGFTIGMILLFPIFLPLLAFGDAEYKDENKNKETEELKQKLLAIKNEYDQLNTTLASQDPNSPEYIEIKNKLLVLQQEFITYKEKFNSL